MVENFVSSSRVSLYELFSIEEFAEDVRDLLYQ